MVAFVLTMPRSPSWNGRWSGESNLHCIVKRDNEVPKELVGKSYEHFWDDGWCAEVEVRHVDRATANLMKKQSAGFCGYDWMVSSIIRKGRIEYNA